MKKLILLLIFASAFTLLSKAYTHEKYLLCSYFEEYKDEFVSGMNVNKIQFTLMAMGDPKPEGDPEHPAYTHAKVTIYGDNWEYYNSVKLENKDKGTKTVTYTYSTIASRKIQRVKLQASGEGRGNIHWKATYSGSVKLWW